MPPEIEALGGDGTGGDYALGAGAGARLWRLGESAAAALTFRPRAATIAYGEKVGVAGYLTLAGSPLAGRGVEIRRTGRQGVTRTAVTATTDAEGFYQAVIAPEATAVWTAAATGPAGETIVSDELPRPQGRPRGRPSRCPTAAWAPATSRSSPARSSPRTPAAGCSCSAAPAAPGAPSRPAS